MRNAIFSIVIISVSLTGCTPTSSQNTDTSPPDHSDFTDLLQKHVNRQGMVDYKGIMRERSKFDKYLDALRQNPPNDETWAENDQIAYWINVYNAFTIDLILRHYPVERIKDIGSSIQIPFVNTPWDIKFIKIGTETYDLNNVEHGILRKKWAEPRIHFAVNCASFSCPRLRNEAYVGSRLDQQLEEQAKAFINNDQLNDITRESAQLSKIFDWYGRDFKKKMLVTAYINQYADVKITEETAIGYKEYDWMLNEQD